MYRFNDYYNNEVKLSFADHPFSKHPRHVLVICRYNDQWLLTRHRDRGLEFPGGKVESGETAEQAAIREVMEETGGVVSELHYLAQYEVDGKRETIVKNVYHAQIKRLEKQPSYYETAGPVLIDAFPKNLHSHADFSFIMKDDIVPRCLCQLKNKKKALR
ncbi:MAG TPA: nucleoside triphosphatase YtkD [Bacillota bacterium]|nr:nucleoside triphosphatase YtkD [Bacillota bacterium]